MAKKLHFDTLIANSKNKDKSMWNIVKTEINNKEKNTGPPLHIEGNSFNDYQDIANIFNAYSVNSANNKHIDILTVKHHALN